MQPLRKCKTGDLAAYKHTFRWIIRWNNESETNAACRSTRQNTINKLKLHYFVGIIMNELRQ